MDGMLSQDEINALLSGMDLSNEGASDSGSAGSAAAGDGAGSAPGEVFLSDMEKDAIGEVANISMGSSATTLYSLVNQKVNITTPTVSLATWNAMLEDYERPCVFIRIQYTKGLDGSNILVLREHDVKVITDLMMGGDGTNTSGELGELHLSAISEAMNQMMGASATSLSTMLQKMIDISPPEASLLDLAQYDSGAQISPFLGGTFVRVSFRMQIGDLVDSSIMQLYPVDFAKDLVNTFVNSQSGGSEPAPAPSAPAPAPAQTAAPQAGMPQGDMGMQNMGMPNMGMGMNPMMGGMDASGMGMQNMGMPGMNPMMNGMNMGMNPMMNGMNPMMMGMPGMGMNPMMMGMPQPNVQVQPAQFNSFSNEVRSVPGQENIGLIMDVPLEVTVELGRTSKSISEILNFAPGTIIELDRIAGEPIDVLVNGKFVAKGEVVVIEESFGVRVTEIIK